MNDFVLLSNIAKNMSIGEAAIVAIVSICVVMIILFAISAVLSIFNVVYKINQRKFVNGNVQNTDFQNNAVEKNALPSYEKSDISSKEENKSEVTDSLSAESAEDYIIPVSEQTQLVAVITAAIAASMDTTTDKIVVHSIRRAKTWKNTALRENLNTANISSLF